jgi:hypothetical protein
MKLLKYLTVFFFCLTGSAFAGSVSLFLNNKPYNKPVFAYKGQVFVELEDIASALNLKLVEQGRRLCAVTSEYKGSPCPSSPLALLYLNGKAVNKGVSYHHGKVWLSISALGKALGYYYDYNPQTGIADLAAPPSPSVYSGGGSSQNAGVTPKDKSGKKEEENGKDPLTVSINCPAMCYPDPTTYGIRLSFVVTNISDKPVKGIVAVLKFNDLNGNLLASQTFQIGALDPGKSITENAYYLDVAEVPIQPVVDLDWEGKKKNK